MENHVPITADLGTYIWGVLVLIFEKSVAIVSMGTYICGVATCILMGTIYSREYGIPLCHSVYCHVSCHDISADG